MSAAVRSLGIFLGDGEAILGRAASAHPEAYGACPLALTYADRNGSQTRSRLEFFSLARTVMLDDLIGAATLDLILHPVSDAASLVRTLADISPEFAAAGASARRVAAEGYTDCRVFASDDGVLVVRRGFEHLAKAHFDNPGVCHETPSVRVQAHARENARLIA